MFTLKGSSAVHLVITIRLHAYLATNWHRMSRGDNEGCHVVIMRVALVPFTLNGSLKYTEDNIKMVGISRQGVGFVQILV